MFTVQCHMADWPPLSSFTKVITTIAVLELSDRALYVCTMYTRFGIAGHALS
jgi:hypothetical protein